MPKLIKDLFGCRDGQVYPEMIAAGEECPPELVAAAEELGCLARGSLPSPAPAKTPKGGGSSSGSAKR